MPSYYQDGTRYQVHGARSTAHFRLHTVGVHLLHGTLAVRDGSVVVDPEGGLRAANFRLDAASMVLQPAAQRSVSAALFGGEAHPSIDFETQWARQVGPGQHELDGVLRMHGHAHLFTLRAENGTWGAEDLVVSPPAGTDEWYVSAVRGTLDRRAWELKVPTLADAALILVGHDVHFEVQLRAGPREARPS